ncbi:hypothetical protein D3C81_1280590 [compost metagenome]
MANQLLVGHQVAVADLHAFGQRGGARGVLQERDVVAGQGRCCPALGQCRVQAIHRQQFGGTVRSQRFQALQAVVQGGHGQQQARLGIVDDRQQALLVVLARRLRRIGWNRDDTGIQAAKERRDVVRPAGEQQHRAVAKPGAGLQGGGDGARPLVQVPIAEHGLLAGSVGEKAQGDSFRGLRGALRQGLDQREREFEGVRHGVFLPVSGEVGPAAPRKVGGQHSAAGCTQGNGWAGEEIKPLRRGGRLKKVNCITLFGLEPKATITD